MTTIDLGNIGSKKQADKIKETLQGQTFMDLQVIATPYMDNWPVTVATDYETTEDELKDFVLFYLAISLR